MAKQPHVWLVETFYNGKWHPTQEAYWYKDDAMREIKTFSPSNDPVRIRKYIRSEP